MRRTAWPRRRARRRRRTFGHGGVRLASARAFVANGRDAPLCVRAPAFRHSDDATPYGECSAGSGGSTGRHRARCLHARPLMRSIIRQNGDPPALPDLRNLGTMLRILARRQRRCGDGCAGARAALGGAGRHDRATRSAAVEPPLLLALAVLWALAPWLARQPYRTGSVRHRRDRGRVRRRSGFVPGRAHRSAARAARLCASSCSRSRPRCVLLAYFRLRATRAVAGDHRSSPAGAAGAHPPALPVQQHQRRAVAGAQRPDARRGCAARHGRPVPRADARQPRPRAARRRGDAVPAVPRPREAAPRRAADRRLERQEHARATRSCRRSFLQPLLENAVYHGIEPSQRAGHDLDQHLPDARRSPRDPAQPVSRRRRPPPRRQQDGARNIRERLALHFDAEAIAASRACCATATRCTSACRIAPSRRRSRSPATSRATAGDVVDLNSERAKPRCANRLLDAWRPPVADAAAACADRGRRGARAPPSARTARRLRRRAAARRRRRSAERARGARSPAIGARGSRAHRHPHAGHGRARARPARAEGAAPAGGRSSRPRSTSTRCRRSRSTPSTTW